MGAYYDNDPEWPIEEYDSVSVVAGNFRFPAIVKKVAPRTGQVTVSFHGIDPVLDMIILRKTAKVPATALELIERSM